MFHSTEFRRLQEERGTEESRKLQVENKARLPNYNSDLLLEAEERERKDFLWLRGNAASPNESNEGREEMEKECPQRHTVCWSTERNAKWQEQNCRQAKKVYPCLINRKSHVESKF